MCIGRLFICKYPRLVWLFINMITAPSRDGTWLIPTSPLLIRRGKVNIGLSTSNYMLSEAKVLTLALLKHGMSKFRMDGMIRREEGKKGRLGWYPVHIPPHPNKFTGRWVTFTSLRSLWCSYLVIPLVWTILSNHSCLNSWSFRGHGCSNAFLFLKSWGLVMGNASAMKSQSTVDS